MAGKHQYKIGAAKTRREAGRKWRRQSKQLLQQQAVGKRSKK
jgi:hypothetical protein